MRRDEILQVKWKDFNLGLRTASKIMGHSSLDMTMRYVHLTDADKHKAVQKVAENLFRTCQKHANARGAQDTARVDASAQIH